MALASPTWPVKVLVATADFGEDETAEEFFFIEREAGVEGKLDVVGAGKLP